MRKEPCSKCGAEARVIRGRYRFRESGLRNVILQGIAIIRCPACRNEDPILPRLNRLLPVLALSMVNKPYRLRGEEIRFLRKYLGKTGEEFARLIHVDKTTLSKWENNDDRVGDQSDRLIRLLVLALGEGLRDFMAGAVEGFPKIRDRKSPVRIEVDSEKMAYQYA